MTYNGYQPGRSPLAQEQFSPADFRYPRLDGSNVAAGLFKNGLINGSFDHWQRGATLSGQFTTPSYIADRWGGQNSIVGSTLAMTRRAFNMPGVENGQSEARYYMEMTYAGGASAADITGLAILRQNIENVWRYSGKRIAVRFRARQVGGAGKKLSVNISQNFGTGGAPSTQVNAPGGLITLQDYFQLHTVLIDVPSVIGKTFGANNDHYLALLIWLSAGSDHASRTGGLTPQDIQINITDIEVREVIPGFGDQLGPYERVPADIELLRCMEYYQTQPFTLYRSLSGTVAFFGGLSSVPLTPNMRATPSVAVSNLGGTVASRPATAADIITAPAGKAGASVWFAAAGNVGESVNGNIVANAEL
jgi:hypothetical protein